MYTYLSLTSEASSIMTLEMLRLVISAVLSSWYWINACNRQYFVCFTLHTLYTLLGIPSGIPLQVNPVTHQLVLLWHWHPNTRMNLPGLPNIPRHQTSNLPMWGSVAALRKTADFILRTGLNFEHSLGTKKCTLCCPKWEIFLCETLATFLLNNWLPQSCTTQPFNL